MKPSDENCKLIFTAHGGISGWEAFVAAGGHLGTYTSVMENYVEQRRRFKSIASGWNGPHMMEIYNLTLCQYDLLKSNYKQFCLDEKI